MTMKRRDTLALGAAALLPAGVHAGGTGTEVQGKKVLRYAFPTAETGFDPAQINDLYSRTVTPHVFEGLYQYDPLSRPAKVRPQTAVCMPEVSDDFKT